MKISLFKKYFLFALVPALLLPTIFLASCSNNQISQFGNYVSISTTNIKPYDANQYQYDPVSGSFLKNGASSSATSDAEFSPFFSFIEQNRLYVDKLISLAHADSNSSDVKFSNDKANYSNQIFSSFPSVDLLHEFLLASANNLNQGGQNYKLAVSNIYATPTSVDKLLPTDTTESLVVDPTALDTVYFNSSVANVVNISMTFSYYDATVNDLYRTPVTDINLLNNYIINNKSWGPNSGYEGFKITQSSYTISFNLESSIRSVYKLSTPAVEGTTSVNYDSTKMTFSTLQFCFKSNIASPLGSFLQAYPTKTSFENEYSPSSTTSSFATFYQELSTSLALVNIADQLNKFQQTITLVK